MLLLVYLGTSVLHLHYLIATAVAFGITLIAGYSIHKYWTFQDHTRDTGKQFGYHTLLTATNFFINFFLMYIMVGVLHIPTLIAQLISSALIAIESYILYKTKIFQQKA
jgi:putative flippase GtrA